MRGIQFVPANVNINFIGRRLYALIVTAVLVVGSLIALGAYGLNFGIDFRGGHLIEVQTDGPADLPDLRARVNALDLGDVTLQDFGSPTEVLIRVQQQEGIEEGEQQIVLDTVRSAIDDQVVEYRRVEFVGPTVGQELIRAGTLAVLLSLGAMLLYIWFRFEWQFGVAALVALVHDVIATLGFFAVTQLSFELATVAAVLTIAGYSINDTVVVFDRVRENMRRYKSRPLPEVYNWSINQTLARTLVTSGTTLLALLSLYFFGGPVIQSFVIALIWGVVIGTFSSIFVASPVLLFINQRTKSLLGREDEEEDGSEALKKAQNAEKAEATGSSGQS